ncbi:decaprenyl-phosphate phosphoribosyltransferase [Aphanothece sacrum]|nr:decaprenyl-phosphate phosphoribosyltransferase [Aphanothece sacrum]GBF85089.1 phosphoribose diphosphate:decaprenyl-phosphate phosphoribosyltransferase [Aphanothece sacrum FPU3]
MLKSPYFLAIRPHQWTKNLIVFAAPLFGFSINEQSLLGSTIAFIAFCSVSSCFYLFNDIADVESDRQHPIKCQRPIASGAVKIPTAIAMAIVLLVGAILLSWWRSPFLCSIIIAYCILQVAYNLKLKHKPIVDIIAIATGFVLRACAGGAATSIHLSVWFLLCTAMLALFLAVEKRKAELRLLIIKGGKTRKVLRRYSLPLLTRMENVVTTGAIMSYALWSAGPSVNGASTSWMMITLPFVLYGIFRYQLLSEPKTKISGEVLDVHHRERTERPDEILLKDRPILLTVIFWIITVFVILWLKSQGIIQ